MSLQLGIYRHYKGKEYHVLGIAQHSETDEDYVVYRPLYGERRLSIRPLAMFMETIEHDGRAQPRFAYARPAEAEPGFRSQP